MPNPSHLEAVDPVVVGFSGQRRIFYIKVITIKFTHTHSRRCFVAGQNCLRGIANEWSQRLLYRGTIHFVINNQIGFTTDFDDARSSDYCTSLASIQAPVLHVNGDDPEAVIRCAWKSQQGTGSNLMQTYLLIWFYRRHGHNEGDDPKFTQPICMRWLKSTKTPWSLHPIPVGEWGKPMPGIG